MRRMLIVSNRLPISVSKKKGIFNFVPSAGGLATGLSSFYQTYESLWIGWPGIIARNADEKQSITARLKQDNMFPVFLSRYQIEKYYEGFSNKTIWPLFHYFTQYAIYDNKLWDVYRHVNKIFCDEVLNIARADDIIWIHDYQLMLLPGLIREKLPEATIGFFLHIPFPSFEMFRTLPWRNEILSGLLGADLIGFHTYDYARHFLSALTRLLGLDSTLGKLLFEDRTIKTDSFPMGIDYHKFADASQDTTVRNEMKKIQKQVRDQKVILSIDRLDYSKAIPQRLKAYDLFLKENPQYRTKVILILVAVPSRSKVEQYRKLKEEVDELIGRINGEYGTIGWTPIWYLYHSLQFPALSALYNLADIALVTPFRDGMNLIAKEYIASKTGGRGVLILSEMAGASDELGEAIPINPNDIDNIKQALEEAITMTEEEQIRRNREMQKKLERYNVNRWAEDFIGSLQEIKQDQHKIVAKKMTAQVRRNLIANYRQAEKRLIFLDYDGTLVGFNKVPDRAIPDSELLTKIQAFASSAKNEVVIISGRDKATLDGWFGELNISLVAEHGAWLRFKGKPWQTIEILDQDWKKDIYPILEWYVDRTPGALIEPKEFSLAWHYRKTDPGLGELRARQLLDMLLYLTANLDLQVLEGSKVIEVKNLGINKGKAAQQWIARDNWDFILAIGDDWTDEDMFKVIPAAEYSIKVGFASTAAKFSIKSVTEVRHLLNELLEERK
jgi:trehalose 6-phosphate synthase/phosphatase